MVPRLPQHWRRHPRAAPRTARTARTAHTARTGRTAGGIGGRRIGGGGGIGGRRVEPEPRLAPYEAGARHAACVERLDATCRRLARARAGVSVGARVRVGLGLG